MVKTAPMTRNTSRWRRPWLLAALVVLVALGLGAYRHFRGAAGQDLRTVPVTLGDLQVTVTAVGSLKPKDYVDVGTQVSGRVMKIHVDIGDRVKKGDLIAEIDPAVYESMVRKDQANLENLRALLKQQQAELELARTQLARNREMLKENAVSQAAVDEAAAKEKVAAATVAATMAQIKAAEATLEGDLTNLGYTKIYAPLDGTVVSQTTLEGQTVNAVQSAPTIVQVANLDVMTVWAEVAEADIGRIRVGMPAYFTTLGMPEKRWDGTVRAIHPTPVVENDVVLYNVLIDVDNRDGALLPQMTVQVFFVLGEAKQVPLAPLNALQAGPNPGEYKARVLTDKGPVERDVKVGLTNRSTAQILSGLQPGEQLILPATVSQSPARAAGPRPPMGPRL